MGEDNCNYPFLCRLKEKDQSLSNGKRGEWFKGNDNMIEELYKTLDIEPKDPSEKAGNLGFEVDAIPDVWARPLLFGEAFYDEAHLLHKQVMGEWRGLLAILALRLIRSINVVVKPVSFDNPPSTRLERTLSSMRPPEKMTFDAKTTWNNLYIIYIADKPIGITSPYTLICTATDYSDAIRVDWFNGKHFEDPIRHLNQNEIEGLCKWLDDFCAAASKLTGDLRDKFVGIVGKYIEDLKKRLPNGADSTFNEKEKPKYSSFLKLDMSHGAYSLLNSALAVDEGSIKESDIRLVTSAGKSSSSDVLVVDANIPKAWNKKPSEVVAVGSCTLANLRYDRPRLDLDDKKYEQIAPAELFTEKIHVIMDSPANMPGILTKFSGVETLVLQGRSGTPILPINRVLLNYLDKADLASAVEYQKTGAGIRVKITLILSGGAFTFEKEYITAKDEIVPLENLPIIKIWPNIKDSKWKAFYTFYSGEDILESFYVTPIGSGEMNLENSVLGKDGNIIESEISKTDKFPEALLCKKKVCVKDNGNVSFKMPDIGILLLQEPNEPNIKQRESYWNIGIDLGTSGTNAFILEEGSTEPKAAAFADRLFHVTKLSGNNDEIRVIEYFIQNPSDLSVGRRNLPFQSMPFQSIFNPFNPGLTSRPLLDGNIVFHPELKTFTKFPNLEVDLKWDKSSERKLCLNVFLTQLCLQLCAEAKASGVNKINWSFSFPTVFSDFKKKSFEMVCEGCIKDCSEMAGLESSEPKSMTESVASACYFRSGLGVPLSRGAVCLDIGGGTTDISIWQEPPETASQTRSSLLPELKWQTSLKLAARDLLVESIRKNITILEKISAGKFEISEDISQLRKVQDNPSRFYAQADAMILRTSASLLKALPFVADEDEFVEFVGNIALGLAGLYHYVGLLLRELCVSGKYRLRMPNICIGGNGSQLFKWVSGGHYDSGSPINNLFSEILKNALKSTIESDSKPAFAIDLTESFKIEPSAKLKSEVAYGLVCPTTHLDLKGGKKGIIAGEAFVVRGEHSEWNENLTAEQLKDGVRLEKGLPEFRKFIDVYNSNCEIAGLKPVTYTEDEMTGIVDKLNMDYSQLTVVDAGSIEVEPIFARILKKFLEMKADAWGKEKSR